MFYKIELFHTGPWQGFLEHFILILTFLHVFFHAFIIQLAEILLLQQKPSHLPELKQKYLNTISLNLYELKRNNFLFSVDRIQSKI